MIADDQAAPADDLAERAQLVAHAHTLQDQTEAGPPEGCVHSLDQRAGLRQPVPLARAIFIYCGEHRASFFLCDFCGLCS
jgi:hypothetical protein